MTYPRCADCSHWKKAGRDDDHARTDMADLRDPITYEIIAPAMLCKHPALRFAERPEDGGAAVVDGSDFIARLMTGPQFGCVRHSAIDATP
jgi:hypothetical protein